MILLSNLSIVADCPQALTSIPNYFLYIDTSGLSHCIFGNVLCTGTVSYVYLPDCLNHKPWLFADNKAACYALPHIPVAAVDWVCGAQGVDIGTRPNIPTPASCV